MTTAHISLLLLVVSMIFYIIDIFPIAVVSFASCAALVLFGVSDATSVWQGFSSDTTLFVAGMVAMVMAVVETGAARRFAAYVSKKNNGNVVIAANIIVFASVFFGGFINNSTAVAITMPIIAGFVVESKGKMHEKHWLLPLASGINAGATLTIIGTTAQMVVQEAIIKRGEKGFGFFDFAGIGLPLCIAFLIYHFVFGKKLNKWIWPESTTKTHSEMVQNMMDSDNSTVSFSDITFTREEIQKQNISLIIVLATIIIVAVLENINYSGNISKGTIAITGTLISILTGCINVKSLLKKFDWTTIIVLACGIGFANGIEQSGGADLIAHMIMGVFGNSLTPYAIFAVLTLTSAILTIPASNTAVAAMLVPIAYSFAEIVDFNMYPVLMGICTASNIVFAAPMATPSMTMVLEPGGYKFMDYIKYCMPYNIIAVILTLVIVPLVWPL